jgi:hypothetical protein
MKKSLLFLLISILISCIFSIWISCILSPVMAVTTSSTTDPTGDLYYYQSGSQASTWGVIDIIYAEVSQVNATHIKLLIEASQTIPLTNQWQAYYWLLDTGISAPAYWNPIDSNDLNVAYTVSVGWAANGQLGIRVNKYDGTVLFQEDAHNNPGKYFSSDTCFITIPLSWIGNPSSIKWVAGSTDGVGGSTGRHDKAPNSGHVALAITINVCNGANIYSPWPLALKDGGTQGTGSLDWSASADSSSVYLYAYAAATIATGGSAWAWAIQGIRCYASEPGRYAIIFEFAYSGSGNIQFLSLAGAAQAVLSLTLTATLSNATGTINEDTWIVWSPIIMLGSENFGGSIKVVLEVDLVPGTLYTIAARLTATATAAAGGASTIQTSITAQGKLVRITTLKMP